VPYEKSYILRRALLLRSFLQRNHIDAVDKNIVDAMLHVPQYLHGARSMETIIKQSIERFTDWQIEAVAERIHEVWTQSKKAAGWVYGTICDDEKKIYPLLVSYDELTEAEKDKDRAIAGNIVPLIASVGLRVCGTIQEVDP